MSDLTGDAADMVNHPPHYQPIAGVTFECIDVTRQLSFNVGNAVKYVWRADRKNGLQDLEKAHWYLRDAIAHGDPIYVGATPWQFDARLTVLARAQSSPLRTVFFNSIRMCLLDSARDAVEQMILGYGPTGL
ncbi:DUF3310 domain-containing protein [Mycolicibacterium mucogenicum]|uniref:DUF3310 domain-containing protein n=1 Tax=Mycolicibacterium mucogenicum DSM 44124 TaxID=1226753 RepID=A0A8H2JHD0_MYCMU|nr:DUF3310 domain-containing protein [Mycolicibacterium mucogenicum]KAB7752776.1 hypothetical protein MMUC44124_26590 [Mycolicibacterium mucogenicum DSM 44124]QPG69109.1 DUF3310 domain-containing protein [Mycolicibacterium mucogenicum DSM 44124]